MKKELKYPLCPYCKKANLELVKADDVYNEDHLQCPKCDSTYCFKIDSDNKIKVIK